MIIRVQRNGQKGWFLNSGGERGNSELQYRLKKCEKVPRLNHDEIENLNRQITSNETSLCLRW